MFGGQTLNAASSKVTLSTMLYVLDFAGSPPRWRQAAIRLNNQGAYQNDWPNTGVAMVPELGAVALKHRSVRGAGFWEAEELRISGHGGCRCVLSHALSVVHKESNHLVCICHRVSRTPSTTTLPAGREPGPHTSEPDVQW